MGGAFTRPGLLTVSVGRVAAVALGCQALFECMWMTTVPCSLQCATSLLIGGGRKSNGWQSSVLLCPCVCTDAIFEDRKVKEKRKKMKSQVGRQAFGATMHAPPIVEACQTPLHFVMSQCDRGLVVDPR